MGGSAAHMMVVITSPKLTAVKNCLLLPLTCFRTICNYTPTINTTILTEGSGRMREKRTEGDDSMILEPSVSLLLSQLTIHFSCFCTVLPQCALANHHFRLHGINIYRSNHVLPYHGHTFTQQAHYIYM